MRVCIYGCGAIGSLLAARLGHSGAETSVIARGSHLEAMQANGLTLLPIEGGERMTVALNAGDDPGEIGQQDAVFLTMKSHAVPAIADAIGPLLGPDTVVVTAYNGIPWWYFYGLADDLGCPELLSVDPGKKLWQTIGPQRALGSVVYPAAAIESPGVVRHVFGDRFALGEPDGRSSARLTDIAELLTTAGFDAPVSADVRSEIWTKLVANAAFNPVSVITGKTLGAMLDDEATYRLLAQIMAEVVGVARVLGVEVAMAPLKLLEATRQLGQHKTSMLQDYEAGRALELGPMVVAILELAEWLGVDVSNLNMVYQLVATKLEPAQE